MAGRRSRRCRAVVLGRTKLKEQDLILTLVDDQGCQVRCVAKGARKPASRLAARTEIGTTVDVLLSEGRGLAIVSEAQIVDAHTALRNDMQRLSLASALAELTRQCSFEDSPDPFLFQILNRALAAAGEAEGRATMDVVYAAYALKVTSHHGWRPVLDACVGCGEPAGGMFSVGAGGVLCESCAKDVSGVRVADEALVGWLAALVGCTFDQLLATPVDDALSAEIAELAFRWACHHLECRLKASEFYLGL